MEALNIKKPHRHLWVSAPEILSACCQREVWLPVVKQKIQCGSGWRDGGTEGGREWGMDGWTYSFDCFACWSPMILPHSSPPPSPDGHQEGRSERTHGRYLLRVLACCHCGVYCGLLNFSGYFLWEDSRYRWHSHHASAEVSAIQVVLDTCGFWCWPRQFEWWNQLVELPVHQKIGTASEDQLPFFIRPLLDGFCLCVGGRFWSEVWSLSDPGCVLDTECSKMSKLLISYFLDIYTHNIFIIYILYSI